jgi:hypothetical protein
MKWPKMPYYKRTNIHMAVCRDVGESWQQELVNVRECNPEISQRKVGGG